MVSKKILFSFFLLIFLHSFGQERLGIEEFIPVNSPDITSFSQVNFLPISEYTGKPNISIPLYEIKLGSLTIPIALTYNYGGVKVDAVASSVGMNWSLQAGGNVVRQVNGLDDYNVIYPYNGYGRIGYLAYGPGADCSSYMGSDGEPDMFLVSAPGLNTKFIPTRPPGTLPHTTTFGSYTEYKVHCEELNKQGNQIKMKAWYYNANLSPYPHDYGPTGFHNYDFDVVGTKIINPNGFEYNFDNFSATGSASQITSWDINQNNPLLPIMTNSLISSHQLSSIFDPSTSKSVYFDYNLPYNQNTYWNNKGVFRLDGTMGSKNIQENIFKNMQLSKIRFENGEIEFFYDFTRLDLPPYENIITIDNKALSRIVVRNNYGKIIKDIRFVYSNVSSIENCTEVECYRLFLDEIHFVGQEGSILPGYKFDYNALKLPKRLSYISDFLGYHNGEVSSPTPAIEGHNIPITYHYPNQGKYSFLPFDIGNSNYQQLNGNFSLAPNFNYAKAGILEKIVYPTGGYMIFENESNEFNLLGQIIQGGGLRVKKQKLYNNTGILEREVNYEYKKEDGTTSGSIVNMPKYNDYIFKSININNGLRIYQTNMANQKTTEASYIGYSRVKVKETGNGHIVKNYTSIEDFPNILASTSSSTHPSAQLRVANGCFPDLVVDNDQLRGKLTQEEWFKEGGTLKQKVTNQYDYKIFGTIPVYNSVRDTDGINDGEGCMYAPSFMTESVNINIERNLLKSTQAILYNNDGTQITTQTDFTYDDNYPFINEKTVLDSENNLQQFKNYYTNDLTIVKPTGSGSSSGDPLGTTEEELVYYRIKEAIDSLKAQHRMAELLQRETYIKEGDILTLLSTQRTNFGDWGINSANSGNIIFPEFNQSVNGIVSSTNKLENRTEFHNYDNKGNLIEASKADGTHVYFIWGYSQNRLIAKIENFTSEQANDNTPINSSLGSSVAYIVQKIKLASDQDNDRTLGTSGKEGALRIELQKLREHVSLSNTEMTSYTYDPLIGITSVTDPKGQTIYYDYDEFNRLKSIKDTQGKILSKNEYHYKNQQ